MSSLRRVKLSQGLSLKTAQAIVSVINTNGYRPRTFLKDVGEALAKDLKVKGYKNLDSILVELYIMSMEWIQKREEGDVELAKSGTYLGY